MARGLSKEDKMFLINTSIYNRDFLLSITNIRLSLVVAATAVVASIFSILLTLKLINPFYSSIISVIVLFIVWLNWYIVNKRLRKRINQIQKQYRHYLTEVYPEIKDSDFYY
jgi:amino acid permease